MIDAKFIGVYTFPMARTPNESGPKPQISIRIPDEVLVAVDEVRRGELRSRANMITKILVDWLRDHGHPNLTVNDPD